MIYLGTINRLHNQIKLPKYHPSKQVITQVKTLLRTENNNYQSIRDYRAVGRGGKRCSLKRCAFSLRLKVVWVSAVLISTGRLFHHRGARTVRDFGQRNQTPDQIQEVKEQRGFIKGSTGSLVVGQAWVEAGQTEAWFRGAGRVEVRGRRRSEPGRRWL